jgi:ATP-dependent Clp protease ATP-binding subunit ClpC
LFYFLSDRFLPDKAIDLIDEAGSRVRLRHAQVINADFFLDYNNMLHCIVLAEYGSLPFQLPDEAKELDKELRQITKQKNEAVRGQDFEKVCYCCTAIN